MRFWRVVRLVICLSSVHQLDARAQATAAQPTVATWRNDLDAIIRDIRAFHPDPFTKTGRLTFMRRAMALRDAIPALSEEQRVVGAMALVASIGDASTLLEPTRRDFARWYPVRFYEFSDGVFVTAVHKSVGELIGAQVLEAGGHPVNEAAEAARALIGSNNALGKLEALCALHSAPLMTGLGYADANGDLDLTLRLANGTRVKRTLHPVQGNDATFEWRSRRETHGTPIGVDSDWVPSPHHADSGNYSVRVLPGGDAVYARMDIVDDALLPFLDSVLRRTDSVKPRRLIIDWRNNTGGDGSLVAALSREFIKRYGNEPWRELYILTGRRTSGAAVMALHALLGRVPLSLVGEPPAAALNHFGDATTRTYAGTGLRLRISTLWWQLGSSDDIREYLAVDVPAPFSHRNYEAGTDPAVDPIVSGAEFRSITEIARTTSGAAARAIYVDRQQRFAHHAWWRPPREEELRDACQDLLNKKRYADALEICSLNLELHPDVWSPWFNLGHAQRLAGRNWSAWLGPNGAQRGRELEAAGLASYRCIQFLDPVVFENQGFRRYLGEQDPGNAIAPPASCPR